MYAQMDKIYGVLYKIIGDIYTEELNYKGILSALEYLRKQLSSVIRNYPVNESIGRMLRETLKSLDQIGNLFYKGQLHNEEVLVGLEELTNEILNIQECFVMTGNAKQQEYLSKKIDEKRNSLADYFENIKRSGKK